jgi:hypothetical protein
MDQAALTREINFLSPFFLLLLPILFLIFKHISSLSSKRLPLPPGPKPWPIIGNILQMGKKPHLSMTHFAQVHGPLISLRLGTQLLVIGSSSTAATEILKTHDRLLSARYVPQVTPYNDSLLDGMSLVWASGCTDKWKFLRALCRTELFSAKAIESQAILREKKVGEMVDFLGSKEGKIVNIGEIVFTTIFNTLANLFFSKDFLDFNQGEASGLKGMIRRVMQLATTPNIADFYPIFAGLDLQGLKKKAFKFINEMYGVWEVLIKERRENHGYDVVKKLDFLDVFLANGFTDDQINTLVNVCKQISFFFSCSQGLEIFFMNIHQFKALYFICRSCSLQGQTLLPQQLNGHWLSCSRIKKP